MAEDLTRSLEEVAKMDTVTSHACTRSGTFALLLSMALFSLIPYWLQEPAKISLGRYVALRLNLVAAINQLDDNIPWHIYKQEVSHEVAESMPIEQLLEVKYKIRSIWKTIENQTNGSKVILLKPEYELIESQTNGNKVQSRNKTTPINKNTQVDMTPPNPVTGLAEITRLELIHRIANLFVNINNSNLLTKSRQAENISDYSIYLWVLKRNSLLERNRYSSDPFYMPFSGKEDSSRQPKGFVSTISKEQLLKYFTIHDVRELAKFELPEAGETLKYAGIGENEINVTIGSLPHNLLIASIIAESFLLLVLN